MASGEAKVDLAVVTGHLNKCAGDVSVDLLSYVDAYRDLHRFFRLLGGAFRFVAAEIGSKIDVMDEYLRSDRAGRYRTVEGMLRHEKENGGVGLEGRPSASRTLLRLHRAVEFIVGLLDKLETLSEEDPTGPAAKVVYEATLGRFHSKLVRKAASTAMWLLPNLRGLVHRTTVHSVHDFQKLLPDTVDYGGRVYRATQDLYAKYDCLDLP